MIRPDQLSGFADPRRFAHPIGSERPVGGTEHWWRSSEGVRDVLGETVAWLYARFFFWPSAPTGPAVAAPGPAQP